MNQILQSDWFRERAEFSDLDRGQRNGQERIEQELATCIEIWENKGVSFSSIASCDF